MSQIANRDDFEGDKLWLFVKGITDHHAATAETRIDAGGAAAEEPSARPGRFPLAVGSRRFRTNERGGLLRGGGCGGGVAVFAHLSSEAGREMGRSCGVYDAVDSVGQGMSKFSVLVNPAGRIGLTQLCKATPCGGIGLTQLCEANPCGGIGLTQSCKANPCGGIDMTQLCEANPCDGIDLTQLCEANPCGGIDLTQSCEANPYGWLGVE